MLADYIGSELEHQLRTKLSIPDKEMKLLSEQAKLVMKSSDNKRKLDNKISQDIDQSMISGKQSSNNKKVKMSRTQVALGKVDKSGMKSISSYFQKKST